MLKNRFIALFVMLSLAIPVFAEPPVIKDVENLPENAVTAVETNGSEAVGNTLDEEIASESLPQNTFKQPVSKRKIAKKFLLAMGGVALSSFLIFAILSIYNRIRERLMTGEYYTKEPSLETPENLNEAVQTFLEKTHWD